MPLRNNEEIILPSPKLKKTIQKEQTAAAEEKLVISSIYFFKVWD